MNALTQGSILYGIRSCKYPDFPCYGIIISASCDIANCKVPKFYYLIATKVENWFSTKIGYEEAYANKIKTCENTFAEAIKDYFDLQTALNFSEEKFYKILKTVEEKRDLSKIKKAYEQILEYCSTNMDNEKRINIIRKENNPIEKYLEKISKGEIVHFYYLPECAYYKNGKKSTGLIVDLQEIEILSIMDAKKIQSPGIDYKLLPKDTAEEQERLKTYYWLETEDDFVIIDENIKSPYIEHLMQRFSNTFIRIGINGATNKDFKELLNNI